MLIFKPACIRLRCTLTLIHLATKADVYQLYTAYHSDTLSGRLCSINGVNIKENNHNIYYY